MTGNNSGWEFAKEKLRERTEAPSHDPELYYAKHCFEHRYTTLVPRSSTSTHLQFMPELDHEGYYIFSPIMAIAFPRLGIRKITSHASNIITLVST